MRHKLWKDERNISKSSYQQEMQKSTTKLKANDQQYNKRRLSIRNPQVKRELKGERSMQRCKEGIILQNDEIGIILPVLKKEIKRTEKIIIY